MLLVFALACALPDTSVDSAESGDTTDSAGETGADTATETGADTATDTGDLLPDARLLLRDDLRCRTLERAYGDADGDGAIDLVVGCPDDHRVILVPAEMEGEIPMEASAVGALTLGADERYADAGDPTADGLLDLLVLHDPGRYEEDMSVWRGELTALRVPGPWSMGSTSAAADVSTTVPYEDVPTFGAMPGDLDGDGVEDVVYAPWMPGGGFLDFLPAGGSSGAAGRLTTDDPVQGLVGGGDLDGDGSLDLLLLWEDGILAFAGPLIGDRGWADHDAAVYSVLPRDVRAAGDVDADGYDDLLVRSEDDAARLVRGPLVSGALPGVTTLSIEGRYGDAAATAELDGDLGRELLIGARHADVDGTDTGAVYVFLAPTAGAWTLADADRVAAGNPGTQLGGALTPLPDLDGAGADEVAVTSNVGVYVFPSL